MALLALTLHGCRFIGLEAVNQDGGITDSGLRDAPTPDAPTTDGSLLDSALVDGSLVDGSLVDGSPADGAIPDAAIDAGSSLGPDCPVALGAGRLHHCTVLRDGALFCWGAGEDGQLGTETLVHRPSPTRIAVDGIVDVMGGRHSTCAAHEDGRRVCFGENPNGQLGLGMTSANEPTPRFSDEDVIAYTHMAQAAIHGCGLKTDGSVYCWGSNASGRLGLDPAETSISTTPVRLPIEPIAQLEAGGSTTCAIAVSGRFYCWGVGNRGACANGSTNDCIEPTEIPSLMGATALSLRDAHGCAILAGEAWCWGSNGAGESGTDDGLDVLTPRRVVGTENLTAIAVGNTHSCAIDSERDRILCWGTNGEHQLGPADVSSSAFPLPVRLLEPGRPVALSASSFATCALFHASARTSTIHCWGRNAEGQTGIGSMTPFSDPTLVTGCEGGP